MKELYNLKINGLIRSRDIAGSSFRSLSNIPHCCPQMESGPCLSPSVADQPRRSAKDCGLGEPLPHQLPIPTKAYPIRKFNLYNSLNLKKRSRPTVLFLFKRKLK